MNPCDFCTEATSGKISPVYTGVLGRTARVLSTWRSFYLVPTISPIAKNHVLLIPKRHITAQTHLTGNESAELAVVEREIIAKLAGEHSSVLLFEHGIGEGATGGCGIAHCHIHIVPVDEKIATSFIARFRRLEVGALCDHLFSISANQSYTYVRVENTTSTVTAVRQGSFPSQFLRNLLEDTLGAPRSNWRDITQTNLFSETLAAAEWL